MEAVKQMNRFRLNDKLCDCCFLFIVGSTIGWCLEVAYRSLNTGALTIPGFLFGPYCPIYGFGILLIVELCKHRKKWVAYLKITACSTILEYIVSFTFETVFHELLWDYSMLRFSIGTRVNLAFSLAWGLLGMVALYWLIPPLLHVRKLYPWATQITAIGGIALVLLDTLASVVTRL